MQAVDEIEKLMQQCNSDIIAVICNRLKTIGELTPTDAIRLSNLAHTEDLNKIMDILSNASEKSLNEVDRAIEEASKENDDLAEQYYQARNMDTTVRSDVLQGIQSRAEDAMKDDILNLSGTAGFYMNGKPTSITATYTNMINKGIYATQQGTMTYQQAIRSAVKQLADSGLRVVDFESGYSRRLDSQVRMNVLDGIRQMNMEYREQQGKEFGADGVEITAHALCAPDHQPYQGKQYSLKDFEYLQSTLRRPIGLMNCRHSTTPIIIGISEPAYSDEQLQNFKDNSNEQVIYNDKLGNEQTCTRYEATQLQRKQETVLRRLKDEKNAYEVLGDDLMVGELDQKIRAQTKYYKDMSAEIGLRPKMERARVQKAQEHIWSKKKSSVPASTIIKEVPKVEKAVKQAKSIDEQFAELEKKVKELEAEKNTLGLKLFDDDFTDGDKYTEIFNKWQDAQKELADFISKNADDVNRITKFRHIDDVKDAERKLKQIGFNNVNSTALKIDKDMLITSTNRLADLEKQYGAIEKSNMSIAYSKSRSAKSSVSYKLTNPSNQDLKFSTYFKNSQVKIEQDLEREIKDGFKIPASKDMYKFYTMTHEYGHIIENNIIANSMWQGMESKEIVKTLNSRDRLEYLITKNEFEIQKEIIEIAKKNNPDVYVYNFISDYGKSKSSEFFAEAFANAHCGEPNIIGNAMLEWLKQKGWG